MRSSLRAGIALVLASGLGCATVRVPSPASGRVPAPEERARSEAETGGEQSLYRLIYDSGEGRTSLKVVLRSKADGRFQIVFSDIAGRRVWSLDHSSERATLVDHRAGTYCVSGPELRLPNVHPRELPLAAIPRVLAGRLPVDPPMAGDREFVDAAGRRWRTTHEQQDLVAWSLLDDSGETPGPVLWWTRDREGGILSRRGGDQYRWKLVVKESSSAPLRDIVPEEFDEGICGG